MFEGTLWRRCARMQPSRGKELPLSRWSARLYAPATAEFRDLRALGKRLALGDLRIEMGCIEQIFIHGDVRDPVGLDFVTRSAWKGLTIQLPIQNVLYL